MALVVDLTRLTAAYGARLMAEAGHRVVRVEPPDGDDVRREGPFLQGKVDLEHGACHHFLNAGKESVTINPHHDDGRKALSALVRAADCVIVSRPFDCDAAWFLEVNPNLALIEVDDIANELCAYARAGLLSLTGHPGEQPLLLGGHAALSLVGLYVGMAAVSALLAAKLQRRGRHVSVSAEQCLEFMVEQSMLTYHTTGKAPDRRGYRGSVTAVSGAFPCADGYWMLSIPHEPEGWHRLTNWVNDPVLSADPSLVDETGRQKRRDFILDRLSAWSQKSKKEDLVTVAQEKHIPASPVSTVLDLAHDPQLIARGFLPEMTHPELGNIRFPMGPIATVKGHAIAPAPRLGEHNAKVLGELGFSLSEVETLLECGAA